MINVFVIGALLIFTYFWSKAAVDNSFLEWLFNYGRRSRLPSFAFIILLTLYLFSCPLEILPKLEIKMADKIYLWIKGNKVYVETPKGTTSYTRSDIRKIVVRYRSVSLMDIVIHTRSSLDTIYCGPRFSIPFSRCAGDTRANGIY